ncbi:MAG: hypothetical protein FWG21_00285, partial [Oscillospiraceae bacterium]|nr:hypothetical protein [Oscillospiraceae bacterium]
MMGNLWKNRLPFAADTVTFASSPIAGGTMNHPLYFAYGSNLNKHDWNRNGFRPPFDDVFEKIGNAWLPDRALAFTYHSAVR